MEILGIVPLEACLIMAENEGSKIGIAGFYDPVNKIFIRMDGKPVSPDFNEQLRIFLDKKVKK